MPRKYLMSWNGRLKAWQKMFRGERYQVYCTDLNAEPTELGSYQAANEWWEAKLATLTHPAERQRKIRRLEHLADCYALHPATKATADAIRAAVASNPVELPNYEPMLLNGSRGILDILEPIQEQRQLTPRAKTVGPHVARFLDLVRPRVKPQSYRDFRRYLDIELGDTKFFGKTLPLDEITETTVDEHYLHLAAKSICAHQKNKLLGFFRRFVGWLGEQRLLTRGLPCNLKTKMHRFKEHAKKIKRYTGVKEVLDKLPDEKRLWALLGCNCGMTQVDIGTLDWSWIDLKTGILTRQRVKLENVKDAPEVRYKLWPETLALLKARPNKKGLVFQTKDGKSMYVAVYVEQNGEKFESKKDLISTYWNRWDIELGQMKPKKLSRPVNPIPIPLGKFRNIGATTLKNSKVFRDFREVFLANVPTGIADRHYSDEADEPFFEALQFIHDELLGK